MQAKPALLAVVLLLLGGQLALADESDNAKAVIRDQIAAFLSDDADRAYYHAAPGIQKMYADPRIFLDMVRRGYGPVFRPNNFAFGRYREMEGNRLVQEVLIAGPEGEDWTAIYVLQKQADGVFKINGVRMVKSAAPQI